MSDNQENKNIEIVSGDGKDLDISPVHTHIPVSKPRIKEKTDKEIIIPNEKKIKK